MFGVVALGGRSTIFCSVQGDLLGMNLRFRLPRLVFITGIEKMYRQVIVDEMPEKAQLLRKNFILTISCVGLIIRNLKFYIQFNSDS